MAQKKKDSGLKGAGTPTVRLKPISKGAIFVFNSIQQGMFGNMLAQIKRIEEKYFSGDTAKPFEYLVAFGPFDNIIRIEHDDFCVVNEFSSLQGVNSQQIQIAYPIHRMGLHVGEHAGEPHFGIITQLKIQNHLMLGNGPEIEEAVATLLVDRLKGCRSMEVELFATLGWDEFIIIFRNYKGFNSLFVPIVDVVRRLTLDDLKGYVDIAPKMDKLSVKEIALSQKHIFLSSYSTPYYSKSISDHLEDYLAGHTAGGKGCESSVSVEDMEDALDGLSSKGEFGKDTVSISTRLSIKPGHLKTVNSIIKAIFGAGPHTAKEKAQKNEIPRNLCSIGRYDMYPWLDCEMSCKQFAYYFELMRYSLGGNLKRDADFNDVLYHTQYYNSFTIISHIKSRDESGANGGDGATARRKKKGVFSEGFFISQLLKFSSDLNFSKSLAAEFEANKILRKYAPDSIIQGLARIFTLFVSCLMDRFTCDSFIDMYPFMYRLKELITTIEAGEGNILFITIGSGDNAERIPLPESGSHNISKPLIEVFEDAIRLFYHGFSNRYLSSYPMMDKNESGVEFSGRLHRVLSAVTGMQNLLLDDLRCNLRKGFNFIGPYPGIRVEDGSFNVTEASVFHLLQIETFCLLHHEVMHTLVHCENMKEIISWIKKIQNDLPVKEKYRVKQDLKIIVEELAGDILLMRNAFSGNYELFGFWYWLFQWQTKKQIDSNMIIRYITLYLLETSVRPDAEGEGRFFDVDSVGQLRDFIVGKIKSIGFPAVMEGDIVKDVDDFLDSLESEIFKYRMITVVELLANYLSVYYDSAKRELQLLCYGTEDDNMSDVPCDVPLFPSTKRGMERNSGRQWSSVRLFRKTLEYIYKQRRNLICRPSGIVNFGAGKERKRMKLFCYRVALINTLQWEALKWKKSMLEEKGIDFMIDVKKKASRE